MSPFASAWEFVVYGGCPRPTGDRAETGALGVERTTADVNRIGNLARRIRLGEDSTLELKRVVLAGSRVASPSRDDFADELAAFANTRGGTVILGVDDKTREIQGIPLDSLDLVEGWAREICNDSTKPALDADIYKMELEGSDGLPVPVIRMEIPRSLFVHRSPGGYFRRLGSSKREMVPEVLARLFQERSQSRTIRFDESVVPNTTPEDLDYALTRRFLREELIGEGVTEDAARKLRIVAEDDDGARRLTLAGVLLCTREPQRWLPHAHVQAVSYAGERTDSDYQTDARDIGGPLDAQVAEAALRAPEHVGACDQIDRAGRATPIQRTRNLRGARERGRASGLLGQARGCACTCSEIGLSSTFQERWRTHSRRTACTCGNPTGMNSSCRCLHVAPPRQVSDARA